MSPPIPETPPGVESATGTALTFPVVAPWTSATPNTSQQPEKLYMSKSSSRRWVASGVLTCTLALLASASAQTNCPGRDNFPLYSTFSHFARKVLVSPNGEFVAFSTLTTDRIIARLRVHRFGVPGTTVLHHYANVPIWNVDMDFVWSPDSRSIFFTAEPTDGSPTNRGSIRRVIYNTTNNTWGTPQVLLNPRTLTWSSMRLVYTDGAAVWGSDVSLSGRGTIFLLRLPPNPPVFQFDIITYTTVPNLNFAAHDGVVIAGSLRLLCSERFSTGGATRFFRLDSQLGSRTYIGNSVTQTLEDHRFASWSGTTDQALINSWDRVALHGVGAAGYRLTSTARVAPTGGGAWNVYLRRFNSLDFRPVIVPARGGGEIALTTAAGHSIWPTVPIAAPSTDDANTVVAWISGGWVYHTLLDRELRAFDRAQAGSALRVTMPLRTGETGVLVLNYGLAPNLLHVPGICYGLALSTTNLTTILVAQNATATAPPLQIPPGHAGTVLHYQAIRFTGNLSAGDFTRVASAPILF